jgi:hypothetical protein
LTLPGKSTEFEDVNKISGNFTMSLGDFIRDHEILLSGDDDAVDALMERRRKADEQRWWHQHASHVPGMDTAFLQFMRKMDDGRHGAPIGPHVVRFPDPEQTAPFREGRLDRDGAHTHIADVRDVHYVLRHDARPSDTEARALTRKDHDLRGFLAREIVISGDSITVRGDERHHLRQGRFGAVPDSVPKSYRFTFGSYWGGSLFGTTVHFLWRRQKQGDRLDLSTAEGQRFFMGLLTRSIRTAPEIQPEAVHPLKARHGAAPRMSAALA